MAYWDSNSRPLATSSHHRIDPKEGIGIDHKRNFWKSFSRDIFGQISRRGKQIAKHPRHRKHSVSKASYLLGGRGSPNRQGHRQRPRGRASHFPTPVRHRQQTFSDQGSRAERVPKDYSAMADHVSGTPISVSKIVVIFSPFLLTKSRRGKDPKRWLNCWKLPTLRELPNARVHGNLRRLSHPPRKSRRGKAQKEATQNVS